MSEKTGIAWCDATFNPVWGCTKVSLGCKNCYAETLAKRWGFDVWGHVNQGGKRRMFGEKHWDEPFKWNANARADGVRRRVFCGSMCDVFEDHPTTRGQLFRLWALIERTPHLDWLILSKRTVALTSGAVLPTNWRPNGYQNVWLGTSIDSGIGAFMGIKALRQTPARVRFISYEPALGPADDIDLTGIHWVIYGGESGPNHRPADPAWARTMRDRCREAGVAFFHKQSHGRRPGTGVELDGEIIQEFPEVVF